jgi:hypothetical protein
MASRYQSEYTKLYDLLASEQEKARQYYHVLRDEKMELEIHHKFKAADAPQRESELRKKLAEIERASRRSRGVHEQEGTVLDKWEMESELKEAEREWEAKAREFGRRREELEREADIIESKLVRMSTSRDSGFEEVDSDE